MPTAAQAELTYKSKIVEPFNPSLARLDNGTALPGVKLTQAAKRLYGRFLRQQMAAQSKGRETFRAKVATLAADLEVSERTIHRALDQLKAADLLQWVRTGRSSWYRLLPPPEIVDNPADEGPPPEVSKSQCQISSDTLAEPHKKASQEPKHNGATHVDKSIRPELVVDIGRRLADLDFKYYQKGHKGPLGVDRLIDRFGVSWLLSWLDKAEDARADLRNPGAWLKKRLDAHHRPGA